MAHRTASLPPPTPSLPPPLPQVPNAMLITSAYAGSAESVAKSAEECCNLCKSAPKAPVTLTCQVWTW